jgi:hypothetical protein
LTEFVFVGSGTSTAYDSLVDILSILPASLTTLSFFDDGEEDLESQGVEVTPELDLLLRRFTNLRSLRLEHFVLKHLDSAFLQALPHSFPHLELLGLRNSLPLLDFRAVEHILRKSGGGGGGAGTRSLKVLDLRDRWFEPGRPVASSKDQSWRTLTGDRLWESYGWHIPESSWVEGIKQVVEAGKEARIEVVLEGKEVFDSDAWIMDGFCTNENPINVYERWCAEKFQLEERLKEIGSEGADGERF